MLRKLNGWQRIGIVLSLAWCLWAAWHSISSYATTRSHMAAIDDELCIFQKQTNAALDCREVWRKSFDSYPSIGWVDLALTIFVPLVLAWLAAWLGVVTTRWIKAGFKQKA